jgi:hypothetical protein
MKKVVLVLLIIVFLLCPAWGASKRSSRNITVLYTEPATDADKSPLTDLESCFVSYNTRVKWVVGKTVLASKPIGGSRITTTMPIPVVHGTVKFKANCKDVNGNVSKDSSIITKIF